VCKPTHVTDVKDGEILLQNCRFSPWLSSTSFFLSNEVYYPLHKSRPFDPTRIQLYSVYKITYRLINIYFLLSVLLHLGVSSDIFSYDVSTETEYAILMYFYRSIPLGRNFPWCNRSDDRYMVRNVHNGACSRAVLCCLLLYALS
jgi:hypothetical protein